MSIEYNDKLKDALKKVANEIAPQEKEKLNESLLGNGNKII